MKKLAKSLSIIFLFAINCFSQQDTIAFEWVPKAVTGINLSQISFTNWKQGGENAVSWTLFGNGSLYYKTVDWHFRNDLKIAFGKTKLGSSDFRTTDNELYIESIISKRIGWGIDPYLSNTIRTALTKGFNYKTDPATEIANFFDPGYVIQSLGFTYDQVPGLVTRSGFAVQEIFSQRFTSYTDDKETAEVEKIKIETGIETVISAEYTLMENILYKGRLRLFSQFESPDVWDIRWDNTIVAKVNKYINVSFLLFLLYEEAQVQKTQIKETLQIGITYTIF
jgi:hypothetical protein